MREAFPVEGCAAGCGLRPRTLAAVTEDLGQAPARERRNAELAALRTGTADAWVIDQTTRSLLAARLTRFQLELAGYCPTCALRGQLKAIETGLRRSAHG